MSGKFELASGKCQGILFCYEPYDWLVISMKKKDRSKLLKFIQMFIYFNKLS